MARRVLRQDRRRFDALQADLGLTGRDLSDIRYQLLHRTASTLRLARDFTAGTALMLVHSFHPESRWLDEYADFVSLFGARAFCQSFFRWYNQEHHHSGIGLLTPEALHTGRAEVVRQVRQRALDDAYAAHPERFVRKMPQPPAVPVAAWINKPESPAKTQT